jgi:hypothetical protein
MTARRRHDDSSFHAGAKEAPGNSQRQAGHASFLSDPVWVNGHFHELCEQGGPAGVFSEQRLAVEPDVLVPGGPPIRQGARIRDYLNNTSIMKIKPKSDTTSSSIHLA